MKHQFLNHYAKVLTIALVKKYKRINTIELKESNIHYKAGSIHKADNLYIYKHVFYCKKYVKNMKV